jgi:HSP20 family protein
MAMMPWDPLRDLLALQEQAARLGGDQGWSPVADVYETPDAYVVMVELPGLSSADIRLDVTDGRQLTVSGGRSHADMPSPTYHRLERGHGRFRRTFAFPTTVDPERITANLAEGVLTVTVPKTPAAGPRRVDIL